MCQCSSAPQIVGQAQLEQYGLDRRHLTDLRGGALGTLKRCPQCGTLWEFVTSSAYWCEADESDSGSFEPNHGDPLQNHGIVGQKVYSSSQDWSERMQERYEAAQARLQEIIEEYVRDGYSVTKGAAVEAVFTKAQPKRGWFGTETEDRWYIAVDTIGRMYYEHNGERGGEDGGGAWEVF